MLETMQIQGTMGKHLWSTWTLLAVCVPVAHGM